MKRFSRINALLISLTMLVGSVSFVTAHKSETRVPESIKDYVEMIK